MKTLIVGLDGVDSLFVMDLIKLGKLPIFSWIAETGVLMNLDSPEATTGPAWTSILTGLDFSSHNINDWWVTDLRRTNRAKRVWEYINSAGMTCAMFNVPMTYPPINCNPYIVAGFPAPDDNYKLCFPKTITPTLDKYGYRMDTRDYDITMDNVEPTEFCDHVKNKVILDETAKKYGLTWPEYLDVIKENLNMKIAVFDELNRKYPADVTFIQDTFFDRASHTHGVDNLEKAEALLTLAEMFITKLQNIVNPDLLFIISDHGVQNESTRIDERRLKPPRPWHTREATFAACGKGIAKTDMVINHDNTISDFAPTILHALGIPLPVEKLMDGKIMYNIFSDDTQEEDDKEIKDQLRGLGYIE